MNKITISLCLLLQLGMCIFLAHQAVHYQGTHFKAQQTILQMDKQYWESMVKRSEEYSKMEQENLKYSREDYLRLIELGSRLNGACMKIHWMTKGTKSIHACDDYILGHSAYFDIGKYKIDWDAPPNQRRPDHWVEKPPLNNRYE